MRIKKSCSGADEAVNNAGEGSDMKDAKEGVPEGMWGVTTSKGTVCFRSERELVDYLEEMGMVEAMFEELEKRGMSC